jgi:hypothetical protein
MLVAVLVEAEAPALLVQLVDLISLGSLVRVLHLMKSVMNWGGVVLEHCFVPTVLAVVDIGLHVLRVVLESILQLV